MCYRELCFLSAAVWIKLSLYDKTYSNKNHFRSIVCFIHDEIIYKVTLKHANKMLTGLILFTGIECITAAAAGELGGSLSQSGCFMGCTVQHCVHIFSTVGR